MLYNDDAIKELIECIILTNRKELYYNQTYGINYVDFLQTKDTVIFQKELQDNLLSCDIIEEITYIDTTLEHNKINYYLEIKLRDYKDITLKGEVVFNG